MAKSGPKAELRELSRSIRELEAKFLAPYLAEPTLQEPSRSEQLDVAAFVVLVHGALENFFEGVALWLLSRAVSNWTYKRRATRCTVSLALYQTTPGTDNGVGTIYDNLRLALGEAKEAQSKAIEGNNGISPRHLKSLFYPVGLDVPSDPVLVASLDVLIKMRHQWAHQFRYGAKVVKSAADAQVAASDCLTFAERLTARAASVKP